MCPVHLASPLKGHPWCQSMSFHWNSLPSWRSSARQSPLHVNGKGGVSRQYLDTYPKGIDIEAGRISSSVGVLWPAGHLDIECSGAV